MQGAKGAALAKLVADKGKTKSKDEQRRAEVTTKVQAIFDATEADEVKIHANNMPVASGVVLVDRNRIAVEVKRMLPRSPDRR